MLTEMNNFLAINEKRDYISFRSGGFLKVRSAHDFPAGPLAPPAAQFFFSTMSEHKPESKKNPVFGYFQDSYEELKKVTWPTRNQAVRLTFIVIGFCIVLALIVGVLDFAFNTGYRSLVDFSDKVAPPAATTPVTTDVASGEPTSTIDLSNLKVEPVAEPTTAGLTQQ